MRAVGLGLRGGYQRWLFHRFGQGFTHMRALYGIAASAHAWIEVPLIVIASTRPAQPKSSSPTATEAAFASADTRIDLAGDSSVTQATIPASTSTTPASANTTAAP